jgi:fatty acid hydroxylase family protein
VAFAATRADAYTRTLPGDRRDAIRARALAEAPRWYNPWVHLAFPSLVGIGLIVASLATLRNPGWRELGFAVFMWLVSNATEWRIHKRILHHRSWPLEVLFDRHTPEHHQIYLRDDMEMRSRDEFRLVLIPSYGIIAIFLTTFPVPLALWFAGYPNLAAVYVATTMAYVVSYEWLHLAYHMPATSFVGRLRIIARLRRHHARHHTPELMQKWNFNVTVPLWDLVMGTVYPER